MTPSYQSPSSARVPFRYVRYVDRVFGFIVVGILVVVLLLDEIY